MARRLVQVDGLGQELLDAGQEACRVGSREKREFVTWPMAVRMMIGTVRTVAIAGGRPWTADLAGRLEAGRVGLHHDVQDDQVGPFGEKGPQTRAAAADRPSRVIARVSEDLSQALDQVAVVVDDEDFLGHDSPSVLQQLDR